MAWSHPLRVMHAMAHDEPLSPKLSSYRHWHGLWQLREHLLLRAQLAAEKRGRSYRQFHVGAAALVTSRHPEQLRARGFTDSHIYTGSNWKLGSEERNTCAEQEIIAQVRQDIDFRAKKILALAIYGQAQNEPDAESGRYSATLHPCRHCRRLLAASEYMTPETIIMTADPNDTVEYMLFSHLLNYHRTTE